MSGAERSSLGLVASALAATDETVAVEDGMNGADRRRLDHGKLADQLVANLGGSPGRVFALDAENASLDLEGQLVGMPIGPPASVIKAIEAAFPIAIEDLVARDARDAELPAQTRHLFSLKEAGDKAKAFIHWLTLFPGHSGAPQMREV